MYVALYFLYYVWCTTEVVPDYIVGRRICWSTDKVDLLSTTHNPPNIEIGDKGAVGKEVEARSASYALEACSSFESYGLHWTATFTF